MDVTAKNFIAVNQVAPQGRVNRSPQHPFNLKSQAFGLTPFLLAPVLPGETMKNLLLQSRVVTDPIKDPIIGWWKEYYFFYVKHRDLDDRDELVKMALDPTWDNAVIDNPTGNAAYYQFGEAGSIDWVGKCLKRVTEEYFREEGQAWDNVMIGTHYPSVHVNMNNFMDSLIDATLLPDVTVDVNAAPTPDNVSMSDLDKAQAMYEFMRANAVTNMTYEQFLATYGVRQSTVEIHRPELLRYVREWSYPTNTIDPADGSPTSAVSWAIAERADKDRFFREPGFIFGVTVTRPKVYLSKQAGKASDFLNSAFSWLPAIMRNDPYTSFREFAASTGPLQETTNGYWIDMRDLFLYGEQFTNHGFTGLNAVALPANDLLHQGYPTDTMSKTMFVGNDVSGGPVNYYIREDGIVSLSISGREVDYT